MRSVRINIVAVEKQNLLHISVCASSLSHPARNAHAPYCQLWPVRHYHMFSHYHIKDTIFLLTYWTQNVCSFSTTFARNISRTKKNSVRYYHKCTRDFAWSTRYSCQILMQLKYSRQIIKWHIKCHETPLSGSGVVACERTDWRRNGRTDRKTYVTKLIVAFRNFANVPKNDNKWTNIFWNII
jgi:hypothetical protein